jgi:peptidoglycan L-alanyl-D-glutamate endopeptidase CwlK
MPAFGSSSQQRLQKVHPDLVKVMNEAIKHIDFSIMFGYRSPEEQLELFKKGRSFLKGKWVITSKKSVVTYMDGTTKKSNHNFSPARAVDIMPYPFLQSYWKDSKIWYEYSEAIKKAADTIGVKIVWGGDWKMFDAPHFELV